MFVDAFADPPLAAAEAPASSAGEGSDRGPRVRRGEPWGPFALAPVVRAGTQIGWGATCSQHVNKNDATACKKQLAWSGMGSAECKLRLKMWLLAGTGIPFVADRGDARTRHLTMDPRRFALATEDEVEQQLLAFAPS